MSISETIAAVSDQLTPTERRIAEVVTAHPTFLAFGTISDLASKVGTSRPSIVRFATKLGFEGYSGLQEYVREAMSLQLSRPSQRIRHQNKLLGPARAALELALEAIFEELDNDKLIMLAKPIVQARRVWILSGETSRAGAYALLSGLSIVRPDVLLVDEHSMGRDLSGSTAEDVAVVIDFSRYRRYAIKAAQTLSEQGIKIVAITDGPLSPLAAITETWCELKVPAIGPFDSSVPAVAVAELLVAQVASQLRQLAKDRIDRTEELWEATQTFLPL